MVNDVFGMRCGYFAGGRFYSFLNDSGKEFREAYSRFLVAKLNETGKDFKKPVNEFEEESLKFEFENLIANLYDSTLKEAVSANYEGTVNVNFIGSSVTDTFKRLVGNIDIKKYSTELYETISRKMIASSALLPDYIKEGIFGHQFISAHVSRLFRSDIVARGNGGWFFRVFSTFFL